MTRQRLHFLLVPDRSAAWRVRRAVAERSPMLGVRVGTWPELLEALRAICLLPAPETGFSERLAEAAAGVTDAFWLQSHAVAPVETVAVLERALTELLTAAGPPGQMPELPSDAPITERGRRHLADLSRLHAAMDGALQADLTLMLWMLEIPPEDLDPKPVIYRVPERPRLDPWKEALLAHVEPPAATERRQELEAVLSEAFEAAPPEAPPALAALQRSLFQPDAEPVDADDSVQWVAARDALDEVEVCAGMIQQALAQDASLAPADCALLLPSGSGYEALVADVFGRAGLPVAGLSIPEPSRDLGRELVLHFLLACRRPAPHMAVAALVSHPFMPWDAALGQGLALDAIGGDFTFRSGRDVLDQYSQELLAPIRRGVGHPKALREALERLEALPALAEPDPEGTWPHRQRAREAIATVREVLSKQRALDWPALLACLQPAILADAREEPPMREGIAVFTEGHEPWRRVRHLFVLGFAEGHYPAGPSMSPVFTDADRDGLRQMCLAVETPAEAQARLRELFRRQLAAAGESVSFLLPRRDASGEALHPSASLAFMARLIVDVDEPEALVLELDRAEDRARVQWLALAPPAEPTPPRARIVSDINLGRNLLDMGQPHQSPSSLETLLVSPLGWLLEQLGLTPADWAPEAVDPMLQGTLAHDVFERLFDGNAPIPPPNEAEARAATLLHQASARKAPFLESAEWHLEAKNLAAEVGRAAIAWAIFLDGSGARVVRPEVWLAGHLDGLPLKGKSDAILLLPDGRLYVVDYKKSRSDKRRTRMGSGYDLQASLYRIILETGREDGGIEDEALRELLAGQPAIGVMYYLMNDRKVLADTDEWLDLGLAGLEEMGADVSARAMALLRERLAAVRRGEVVLNSEEDAIDYGKLGVDFYILDNHPLVGLFLKPPEESVP
jgi:RecB family exonuclease